jgi:hypothetical protein
VPVPALVQRARRRSPGKRGHDDSTEDGVGMAESVVSPFQSDAESDSEQSMRVEPVVYTEEAWTPAASASKRPRAAAESGAVSASSRPRK